MVEEKLNPHFFKRQPGSDWVVIRLKFDPTEANLIEEAAAAEPVMRYIYRTLKEGAQRDIAQRGVQYPKANGGKEETP